MDWRKAWEKNSWVDRKRNRKASERLFRLTAMVVFSDIVYDMEFVFHNTCFSES